MDNQGELLTQATIVAQTAGVSEPIRGEPAGDGTWLIPGLGDKSTLVVTDPLRGTTSVDLTLPEASGGAVVQILWGEKVAEVRIVAILPELTSQGLQATPSIAPSPLVQYGTDGSRVDTCPGDSLFGQVPHQPSESWSFANAGDASGFTYKVYEDFSGVSGDIEDIHWWGLSLHFDPALGWSACDPAGVTYDITFYEDAGGTPGAVTCTYTGVTPTYSGTGLFYAGFEMRYYELDLGTPCAMSAGWVSIQSQPNANDCTFLWASSPDGNGDSLQENIDAGTPPASTGYDRGVCLTGVYQPTYGACCDDSSGTCTDDVEMQDCVPPMRFAANTLCADLDPACGDVTTCQHSIVLTDSYGDGWTTYTTPAYHYVDVLVNGALVLDDITLTTGAGPLTFYFQAATGDSILVDFTDNGSYEYECGYAVFGGSGQQLGSATGPSDLLVTGDCEICIPPDNDECVNATPVSGPYPQIVSGTNNCATVDCPGVLDWFSTWWAIDLPHAVNDLTVSYCGNGFEINHVGVVYYNACNDCANYVLYDGIDWYSCPDGITSPVINWDGIPGPTTVYFPVMFNYNSMVDYTIEINVTGVVVPENDLCENATPVDVPSVTSGTTGGATIDTAPMCGTSITAPGVWYSVIGTGNTMTASLCGGASWDTKLCVYCVDCADLMCVDGNDDACGLQSEVSWCSQAMAEYFVLVHGYGSATGPFDLTISDDGVPCTGAVQCLPEGACCLPTGACLVTTEYACDAAGGDYHGDDTTCGVGTAGDETEMRLDCNAYINDALTTSSPIWDRVYGATVPDVNCNAIVYDSGSNGQYYAVYPIGVAAVENLDIEVLSAGFSDTTMFLYCDPFDPANPMDNVVAYDDDGGAGLWSAFLPSDNIQLEVGVTYFLVLSSYSGGYTGDFEICLRGTAFVGSAGPGACCLPDGTCEVMEAADCNAAGGIFGGTDSDCETYECPEFPGACCLPDGSCTVTIESCCAYAGGIFVGPGSDCGTGMEVIFSEDFEGGVPADWTVTDDMGSGLVWTTNDVTGRANVTGGSGLSLAADSDWFGSAPYDTSAITSPIDLSAALSATVDCEVNFQNYAGYDWFYIDASYDNGGTWTNLLTWNEDHGSFSGPGEHVTLPLAAGSAETLLRFRYYDPVSHWNWFVQVDDLTITAEVAGLSPCQYLDIKPGSCPNSFNRSSRGVLHTALVGTADFDVTMVDISTLLLRRLDGVGGALAPHEGPPGPHTHIEDTATPFLGGIWDCDDLESDGIDDVSMYFKNDDVVDTFLLWDEPAGAYVALVLSGYLTDGSPFVAADAIRLVPPGGPPGEVVVTSNLTDVFLEMSPMDDTLDSDGWTNFTRSYVVGTEVSIKAPARYDGNPFYAWKINGVLQQRGDREIEFIVTEGVQTIEFDAVFGKLHELDGQSHSPGKKQTLENLPLP